MPTLDPVHYPTPTALKAAAPGFPEGQRRLCFSDTTSKDPQTTFTRNNHLFFAPVLLLLSYCPGAMKFDYFYDDKNVPH